MHHTERMKKRQNPTVTRDGYIKRPQNGFIRTSIGSKFRIKKVRGFNHQWLRWRANRPSSSHDVAHGGSSDSRHGFPRENSWLHCNMV